MSWTEERIEQAKKLNADGFTANQIAQALGNTTRNAVLGKLHRLGLSKVHPSRKTLHDILSKAKRARQERAKRVSAPKFKAGRPHRLALPTTPLPDPDQFDRGRLADSVTLLDLEPHHCRYPVGSTDLTNHRFCGLQAHTGLPYCEHHARVAFQPAGVNRKEVREMRPRGYLGRVVIGEVIAISNVTEFLEPA